MVEKAGLSPALHWTVQPRRSDEKFSTLENCVAACRRALWAERPAVHWLLTQYGGDRVIQLCSRAIRGFTAAPAALVLIHGA